jgi:tetratricopeptide (TPR) repeat protein
MKLQSTALSLLLVFSCCGLIWGGPSEDALKIGDEAYANKDYKSALTTWINAYNERQTAKTANDETCAQLLARLGDLLGRTGSSKLAVDVYEKLLVLRGALSGKDNPETQKIKNFLLVQIANSGGDLDRALLLAQEAATFFGNAGPNFIEEHLQSLTNVGSILLEKKERIAAHEVFTAIVSIAGDRPQEGSEYVVSAYGSMAAIAAFFGRSNDEILYRQKAATAAKESFGAENSKTYAARIVVATTLSGSGDTKGAREVYASILSDLEKGGSSEEKLVQQQWTVALYRLFALETAAGNEDRAFSLIKSAFEHCKIGFGETDTNMLPIALDLAKVHLKKGNYQEGVKCYQRVLDIRRRNLGPDSPDTKETQKILNELYEDVRKAEAAKKK